MKQGFFHYIRCGLHNVYLRNGFVMKQTPYGPYGKAVAIHDLEGLHRAIGLYLAKDKPNLSGAEIRFLRKELDMPQVQLAAVIGVGETTIRHWESGRRKISPSAERVLRSLYEEHVCGSSSIKNLVDRLGQINREIHARMEFEETNGGWRAAA